eukprot:COSAG01_NODE_12675_length_1701_cov_2.937578_1_plen_97_part_10
MIDVHAETGRPTHWPLAGCSSQAARGPRRQQQPTFLGSTSPAALPLLLKGLTEGSAADKPERQPQGRRGRGEHSLPSAMEVDVERWPARSPSSSPPP